MESHVKDNKAPLPSVPESDYRSEDGLHQGGITFAAQEQLPRLPIPELEDTVRKYLEALKPLQSPREQIETRQAAEEFLKNEGPDLQSRLKKYANGKTSYIEQFCKSELWSDLLQGLLIFNDNKGMTPI